MRKSTAIAVITSFVVAACIGLAWYVASPFYAVAGLRDAAVRADTKELADRVDFPRVRDGLRAQIAQIFVGNMTESLRSNPFAALGLAFANKLTDMMIEAMVTPVGIAAIVAPTKSSKSESVSGLNLMFSSDFVVHRKGLSAFDISPVRENENTPTLRFDRDGLTWRLVGLELPKEFLAKEFANATKSGPAAAPYVPKWELTESKDSMDDTVTILLSRGADEEVSTRFSSVRPSLNFRCRASKFEAYITVASPVDYDYQNRHASIRLRFDDSPAIRAAWSVSTSREAVFASDPQSFVAALLRATSMQFEWKGSLGSTNVARFSKGDLETHKTRFAEGCGNRELFERLPQPTSTLQSPVATTASGAIVAVPPAISAPNIPHYMVPAGAYVDPAGPIEVLARAKVPYYVDPIHTKDGTVTRLRVGPFASMAEAQAAHGNLKALGLKPGEVVEVGR